MTCWSFIVNPLKLSEAHEIRSRIFGNNIFYRSLSGKIIGVNENESILVIIFLSVTLIALTISLYIRVKNERKKVINTYGLIEKDKQIIDDLRLRLDVLFQIGRGFVQAEDESTIINLVLTQAMNVTRAAGASFVPLDERGQPVGVIRQGEFPFPLPDAWLEYLASPTIRQQCNDCKNHGSIMKICPLLKGPFSQAMGLFCLPLRRCDQDLGILNLYLPNEGSIGAETKDFLQALIDETALALEAVRLRKRELATIDGLKAIRQRSDSRGMMQELLLNIQNALSADYILLAITSDGIDLLSNEIHPDQLLLVGRELSDETSNFLGKVIQQVFTSSKECMSEEFSFDYKAGKSDDTLIAAPLWATDESLMGIIIAGKGSDQHFHEHQKKIFTMAASQIALFVENLQGMTGLQYKATIEERVRLAREIHDGLAQTLGFLKLHTAQMQNSLDKGDFDRLHHMLNVSYSALAETYQDVREAIDGLRVISVGTDDDTQIRLDKAIHRIIESIGKTICS
jgi:signal transduction histidine kinase